MTAQELAAGFIAIIGGNHAAQKVAALYATELLKDGHTIGHAVSKGFHAGKRLVQAKQRNINTDTYADNDIFNLIRKKK